MKIWIVNDRGYMRSILETYLRKQGAKDITMFADGSEVVDSYKEHIASGNKVDLIFMDTTMPNMNGKLASEKIAEILPTNIILCSPSSLPRKSLFEEYKYISDIIDVPFTENEVEFIYTKYKAI